MAQKHIGLGRTDMKRQYRCKKCNNILYRHQWMITQHPVEDEEEIWICPHCNGVETQHPICQYKQCNKNATHIKLNSKGVKFLCDDHIDGQSKQKSAAQKAAAEWFKNNRG